MAKPDILNKLANELQRPIESESRVVYMLVEIRKLLELERRARKQLKRPQDHTYAVLEFCCDWAVHPIMDWENGQRIVRRFDKYQALLDEMSLAKDGDPITTDITKIEEIESTIRLTKFQEQLHAFLQQNNLDTSITDNTTRWAAFLTRYAGVVEDCPLRCLDGSASHTDEVTVRVLHSIQKHLAGSAQFQLVLQWEWTSKVTGIPHVSRSFF